jgi:hypothetical protein
LSDGVDEALEGTRLASFLFVELAVVVASLSVTLVTLLFASFEI